MVITDGNFNAIGSPAGIEDAAGAEDDDGNCSETTANEKGQSECHTPPRLEPSAEDSCIVDGVADAASVSADLLDMVSESSEIAADAMKRKTMSAMEGGPLQLAASSPSPLPPSSSSGPSRATTLWCGDLAHWMDEAFLSDSFSAMGTVLEAKVIRYEPHEPTHPETQSTEIKSPRTCNPPGTDTRTHRPGRGRTGTRARNGARDTASSSSRTTRPQRGS